MYGMSAMIFWPVGVLVAFPPPRLIIFTQSVDAGRLKVMNLGVMDFQRKTLNAPVGNDILS